jgi:hypothetical protein
MAIFDLSNSTENSEKPTGQRPVDIRMISAGVFRGMWMYTLSTIPIWILILMIRSCS